jgi:phosphomevalonate kinase
MYRKIDNIKCSFKSSTPTSRRNLNEHPIQIITVSKKLIEIFVMINKSGFNTVSRFVCNEYQGRMRNECWKNLENAKRKKNVLREQKIKKAKRKM